MLRISSSTHLYRTPPTLVSFGLGVSKLHGAIAHALEQQFPDSVETEPETLAHHFTEAGLTDRAIEYWRKAQTSERYYEAELHRLRGELVIMMGKPSEAEVEFQTAFMVARRQQARWWELRAAATLARLWRDDGKVEGARDLLTPVYSWFTEGFDLPDLRDTNTLLDQLGQHPARS